MYGVLENFKYIVSIDDNGDCRYIYLILSNKIIQNFLYCHYLYRIFYIIRNHNGQIDILETDVTEGVLKFESDQFSTYAIAYKDVETSGQGETITQPENTPVADDSKDNVNTEKKDNGIPQTGDNIIIYAILAVISFAGIVIVKKVNTSKRKHQYI